MDTPVKSGVKSKGVNGARPRLPLESEILRDICDELSQRGLFFWRSNNMPSLGRFGVDGKARFRAMPKHAAKGVADILCIVDGRFIALEVKRPGAKLRPEQAEWGTRVVLNGGEYAKICSVADALAVIYADAKVP